jgi:hypothetical protein
LGKKVDQHFKNSKYISTYGLIYLKDALCVVGDGWIEVVVKT